jgi:hypothetical protein
MLNDCADRAATAKVEQRWLRDRVAEKRAEDAARSWAKCSLHRLRAAEQQYLDRWLPSRRGD